MRGELIGTFSCVFHAESIRDGVQVAIKRIYPTYSPSRIINEIRMLQAVGYDLVTVTVRVRVSTCKVLTD